MTVEAAKDHEWSENLKVGDILTVKKDYAHTYSSFKITRTSPTYIGGYRIQVYDVEVIRTDSSVETHSHLLPNTIRQYCNPKADSSILTLSGDYYS